MSNVDKVRKRCRCGEKYFRIEAWCSLSRSLSVFARELRFLGSLTSHGVRRSINTYWQKVKTEEELQRLKPRVFTDQGITPIRSFGKQPPKHRLAGASLKTRLLHKKPAYAVIAYTRRATKSTRSARLESATFLPRFCRVSDVPKSRETRDTASRDMRHLFWRARVRIWLTSERIFYLGQYISGVYITTDRTLTKLQKSCRSRINPNQCLFKGSVNMPFR
jgi:hypothetical protein